MVHYSHRQVGWPLNTIIVVITLAVAVPLMSAAIELAVIPLLVLVAVLVFFSTLTVTVDDVTLEAKFGVGIIRKRIPLNRIRSVARVRNPWYYGWGIHGYPGGMVYNVSGFDAVELTLDDGGRVRIGTDEPDALVKVLSGRVGSVSARPAALEQRAGWVTAVMIGCTLIFPVAVTVAIAVASRQPVRTTIADGTLTVSGGGYSRTVPLRAVTHVTLENTLPSGLRRTNGLSAFGTLRGHFKSRDGHAVRLFVERSHAPYIEVRTSDDTVWFDLGDAAATRAMFQTLTSATTQSAQSVH